MTDAAFETPERTPLTAIGETFETAAEYVASAGATAGASVKAAAGKTGAVVSAGSYKAAYGLSFGVVFSAVFLKEFLPAGSVVRRGFEDGAEAAFDAVEARKSRPLDGDDDAEAAVAATEAPKAKRFTRKVVKATSAED